MLQGVTWMIYYDHINVGAMVTWRNCVLIIEEIIMLPGTNIQYDMEATGANISDVIMLNTNKLLYIDRLLDIAVSKAHNSVAIKLRKLSTGQRIWATASFFARHAELFTPDTLTELSSQYNRIFFASSHQFVNPLDRHVCIYEP